MAITEAAYLRVGLGMIPKDVQNEMKEKHVDTTSEWRLPSPGESGTSALSESEQAAIGLAPHLSTEKISPLRQLAEWDWQPDPSSLARNPLFQRFGQVMEQIEQHIAQGANFEHLVDELDQLEGFTEDEDIEFADLQERQFVRQKIGGAKRAATKAYTKWKRQNPGDARKKNVQGKRWHAQHKSHDKMVSKTSRAGYRRADADMPEANLSEAKGLRDGQSTKFSTSDMGDKTSSIAISRQGGLGKKLHVQESYTGRMQGISDNPFDRDEQRRLAGLTESKNRAFSSMGVVDARRPQNVVTEEAPTEMLASFRHLMGWRG